MQTLLIILSVFLVSFTDKAGSDTTALSEKAIRQRQQWDIPTDSLDYPVSALYIDSMRRAGLRVYHTSRWFNAATVEMTDSISERVRGWSFVKNVECTRSHIKGSPTRRKQLYEAAKDSLFYGSATAQIHTYNLPPLHKAGYKGQGILMAVCDGGFHRYDQMNCFDKSHFKGAFDFTDDEDSLYGSTGNHGTYCLSTIAAKTPTYMGSATEADYYLMRSEEYNTESMKEVDNLVVALETADSLGVNIFSVSLGYSTFDEDSTSFSYADMNGKTSRASIAAAIAARKGMLVCVAGGNEGDKSWYYITSPGDADSILTVGAVDTLRQIGSFSSHGPSADKRVKPDICAVGWQACVLTVAQQPLFGNGTSFACPLLAGMAASLWSALPQETNMQIRQRIISSADKANNPDNDYGYGIPDAWTAYTGVTPTEVVNLRTIETHKILKNGRLWIFQNGVYYDIMGQKKE